MMNNYNVGESVMPFRVQTTPQYKVITPVATEHNIVVTTTLSSNPIPSTATQAVHTPPTIDRTLPQTVNHPTAKRRTVNVGKKPVKREGRKHCDRWTKEENELLGEAILKLNLKNWNLISKHVGTKNGDQCNQHWHRVLNPAISKKAWSAEEDEILTRRVAELGESAWKRVSEGLPGRTDIQCRHRWIMLKRLQQEANSTTGAIPSKSRSRARNKVPPVKVPVLNADQDMPTASPMTIDRTDATPIPNAYTPASLLAGSFAQAQFLSAASASTSTSVSASTFVQPMHYENEQIASPSVNHQSNIYNYSHGFSHNLSHLTYLNHNRNGHYGNYSAGADEIVASTCNSASSEATDVLNGCSISSYDSEYSNHDSEYPDSPSLVYFESLDPSMYSIHTLSLDSGSSNPISGSSSFHSHDPDKMIEQAFEEWHDLLVESSVTSPSSAITSSGTTPKHQFDSDSDLFGHMSPTTTNNNADSNPTSNSESNNNSNNNSIAEEEESIFDIDIDDACPASTSTRKQSKTPAQPKQQVPASEPNKNRGLISELFNSPTATATSSRIMQLRASAMNTGRNRALSTDAADVINKSTSIGMASPSSRSREIPINNGANQLDAGYNVLPRSAPYMMQHRALSSSEPTALAVGLGDQSPTSAKRRRLDFTVAPNY